MGRAEGGNFKIHVRSFDLLAGQLGYDVKS